MAIDRIVWWRLRSIAVADSSCHVLARGSLLLGFAPDTAAAAMGAFQTSQRSLSWLPSRTNDCSIFYSRPIADFDSPRFVRARANPADFRCVTHGFSGSTQSFVFRDDANSFADSTTTYRCALQKSEGALDWSGGDGRSRVGH